MFRQAVVVAHPDDETLWAGGYIAQNPGIDVICCSVPQRDPERAIKFSYAVKVLRGFPILIPFVESPPGERLRHLDAVSLKGYDRIITHNEKGEYGHVHHKQVHEFVVSESKCDVWTFQGADIHYELSEIEQLQKEMALRCYDHVSNADNGKPKFQALLDRYNISMKGEGYDFIR